MKNLSHRNTSINNTINDHRQKGLKLIRLPTFIAKCSVTQHEPKTRFSSIFFLILPGLFWTKKTGHIPVNTITVTI